MAAEIFTITSSSLPDDAHLVAFHGVEKLSHPFAMDVYVQLKGHADFDQADTIGGKATITIDRGEDAPPFVFHGVFSSASLLHAALDYQLYHFELVPRLWLLGQTRHSRMFTEMNIVDIISAVLDEGGLTSDDFEFRVEGTYEAEAHVCQYRESDLDFIHRWLELEGMYYFFEHGDDAEKLIITDHPAAHEDLRGRPVTYLEHDHGGRGGDHVDGITRRCRHLPATVRIADYDYDQPTLDLSGESEVSTQGVGDVVYHNARFFTPDAAARYSAVRAEELKAREWQHHATGTAFHLRTGYTFELEGHPNAELNLRHLVTELVHEGNASAGSDELKSLLPFQGADVYRVEVSTIPADVQFRPVRRTAWPRIHGFENALIDGPATSDYAQLDDQGRYSVKFLFDEGALTDGNASTWIRMVQPHGGRTEGFHFPLRKGTEVLISFVGGDPDRPLIAGVAPNAHTPSPVTSANHTKNVIQTGGRNLIEMEDLDGSQRVTFSTPTENTMLRLGAPNDDCNARLTTDGLGYLIEDIDFKMETGHNKTETDRDSVYEIFVGDFSTTVTGATTEHYKSTKEETVHGELEENYKSKSTTVTGAVTEVYKQKHRTEVSGARNETLEGVVDQEYGSLSTTVENAMTETFQGGFDLNVGGNHNHTVSGKYTLTAGDFTLNERGDFENKFGPEFKMVFAATSETFIGIKNENLVGGKVEVIPIAKIQRTISLNFILHAGGHAKIVADETETEGVHADLGASANEAGAGAVENVGAATVSHGAQQGEI